jgi:lipopolysaccharide/colanic/teichoic acid biosynthesis glycosyltransferase
VVTRGVGESEESVTIDLEPWDCLYHIVKRLFSLVLAGVGLLVLTPVMAVIGVAVKLYSPGPVLYSQERTAEFVDMFTVSKFRSMVPDAEAETVVTLPEEDNGVEFSQVTRIKKVLCQTQMDEIPQLWSILVGDMSVVGPRPERPELDADIERGVEDWHSRWFLKPGLTGLAQIYDATGHEPGRKLRYDLEYIRKQSF